MTRSRAFVAIGVLRLRIPEARANAALRMTDSPTAAYSRVSHIRKERECVAHRATDLVLETDCPGARDLGKVAT
jgi:hypothetical protein